MSFKRVFISRFIPGAASFLERRVPYTTPSSCLFLYLWPFPSRCSLHPSPPVQSVSLRRESEIAAHREKKSTDLCGPYCPRDTARQRRPGGGRRDRAEGGMARTRERGEGETGKGRQRDFPNAFQPTELNVIMHGEDFIIGR